MNPNCLWCSVDSVPSCVNTRSVEVCLPGSSQPSFCPGLCELLNTCEACIMFGRQNSSYDDDDDGGCVWCVLDSKCRKISSPQGMCRTSKSSVEGWWKDSQTELVDVLQCILLNKPPGLFWLRYKNPANFQIPDEIELVRNSTNQFHFNTNMDKEYQQESTYMARLVGFLHPPPTKSPIQLSIYGASVHMWLYLSNDSTASNKEMVADIKHLIYSSTEARRPDGSALFASDKSKYYVELVVNQTTPPSVSQMAVGVGLKWNVTPAPSRKNQAITLEFLEPPSGANCSHYQTCLSCMTDTSCGWCVHTCIPRILVARSSSHGCSPTRLDSHHLIVNQVHCPSCSNYTHCSECVQDVSCEWLVMDARCFRRGRFNDSLIEESTCPLPCHVRNNVTWCLRDENECAWCEETRRCFAFVEYIPRYSYGGCRLWLDSATDVVPLVDCTSIDNCSLCLSARLCGWCYVEDNPSIGSCRSGDFSGTYDDVSCKISISQLHNVTTDDTSSVSWSYESCPDVDECFLELDECHEDASCTNVYGSYNCICRRGFLGDGRTHCNQTCYEDCVNGRCLGFPDYVCNCDVGWTGSACDADCGCNLHSSCSPGVGFCDECLHGTMGLNCQLCLPGFYGSSSSAEGCLQCKCNGHSDEELGICNSSSGVCFCKHDTTGHQCHLCSPGYYGDPRNSGRCFKECDGRNVILGASEGGFGTANVKDVEGHLFCLWIVSIHDGLDADPSPSRVLTLTVDGDMNITCDKDRLYIYDGIPSFFGFLSDKKSNLLAALCGGELNEDLVFDINSGHLVVLFEFTIPRGSSSGYYGFNATFLTRSPSVHSCDKQALCERMESSSCDPVRPEDEDDLLSFNRSLPTDSPPCSLERVQCSIERCLPTSLKNLLGHSVVRCSGGNTSGIFLFGGKNFVDISNDVWFFDFKMSSWTVVQPSNSLKPQARYLHVSECVAGTVVIHGGVLRDGNISNDTWQFDLLGNRWTLIQQAPLSSPPPKLAGHTMTLTENNQLFVIGSLPSLGNSTLVHKFDFLKHIWSKSTVSSTLIGLYGHSATYHKADGLIYIYGGYQLEKTSGFHLSNRLHFLRVDLKVPKWTTLDAAVNSWMPPSSIHSAFSFDDFMIVVGGNTLKPLFYAYVYRCQFWTLLDHHDILLPKELKYLGTFVSNDDSIYGIATSGGFKFGVLTRMNFGGDVCKLIKNPVACSNLPTCVECLFKETYGNKFLCLSSSSDLLYGCVPKKYTGPTNQSLPTMMAIQNCLSITSCFNCTGECVWCSKCSKCIVSSDDCSSICSQTTLLLTSNRTKPLPLTKLIPQTNQSASILEPICTALTCASCLENMSCIWVQPRCSGQGCSLGSCQLKSSLNSSNPTCPPPCSRHSSCSDCFDSDTTCLWSVTFLKCMSAYDVGIFCPFGECGSLIGWSDKDLCPSSCDKEKTCSSCLRKPHCGWCYFTDQLPGPGGGGVCREGGLTGPYETLCHLENFGEQEGEVSSIDWTFSLCPHEDECKNEHHTCDDSSQYCVDQLNGFECHCRDGFNFNSQKKECLPHCSKGCVRGSCISPEVCKCSFGHVGSNCSVECKCNQHSDCESVQNRSKCLACLNNTMGDTCDKCKPLFVGNPQNGGKCESCLSYCHEHSRVCLSKEEFNHTLNYPDLPTNAENIVQWLKYGPYDSNHTKCLSCGNNTQGDRCEKCKLGYFRQFHLPPSVPCQKCLCNGHSDYCDPDKGDGCDCRNNTKSERCDSSEPSRECFKSQCSQCVDNFLGTPTNGHQCYRQINVESQQCFDPDTQMNCNPTSEPNPLLQNITVFFAIQPKYLNVNIRIFIDVTKGGLNLYFAPADDAFQVFVNRQSEVHKIVVDPKYLLHDPVTNNTVSNNINGNHDDEFGNKDDIGGDDDSSAANDNDEESNNSNGNHNGEENEYKSILPSDYSYDGPYPTDTRSPDHKSKRGFMSSSNRNKKHGTSINRRNMKAPSTTPQTMKTNGKFSHSNKQKEPKKVYTLERVRAEGPITFVTVDKPDTLLIVENIVNRLVVILPNNVHPLKVARFYLVLLGAQSVSYGAVFMKQDQPHIDLFVFFSVFFSCFFLFLAVCVLLWKAKQMNDARRSRHRSLLEMEHMASRPSARAVVVIDDNGCGDFYIRELRSSPTQQRTALRVVKMETSVRIPGNLNSEGSQFAPAGDKHITAATVTGRTQNKQAKNFVVHPIAIEYTHDNSVAIATFLFDLPGANSARMRSCFGSCLVPSSNLQNFSKV